MTHLNHFPYSLMEVSHSYMMRENKNNIIQVHRTSNHEMTSQETIVLIKLNFEIVDIEIDTDQQRTALA